MDKQVIEFLRQKSIKVIQEDVESKLETWGQYYRGKVDGFHNYTIYQGKKKLERDRATLNMPLRVCQKWANLLLNEKCEIDIEDEYTNKTAHKLLEQVNFRVKGNNLLEAAFACGGGFFIQFWDGEKVNQKYITQNYFYPISFDTGRLTEAAFASNKTIGGKKYTYLETHTRDDNGFYVIDNFLLQEDGKQLEEVSSGFYELHGIAPKIETHSTTPLFQYIRPNVANRDMFDSPFGVSVFDGATDIFKTIDTIYDSYKKEFVLGRKRIFVTEDVTSVNYVQTADGMQTVEAFDPNDEVFYHIPNQSNEAAREPIKESNLSIRVAEHDTALQTQLNLLSEAVGFGGNGFKWDGGNVTTATQIISENSEMFRNVKKHELLLRPAVIDMVRSLLYLQAMYTGDAAIKYDEDITVDFDDSIIEDTAEIKRQALLELNSGIIDVIQYYIDVYKMTEEQATDFYNKMKARMPAVQEEPTGA